VEPEAPGPAGDEEARLAGLERAARPLDPSPAERRALTRRVVAHLERFLTGLDGAPAFVEPEAALAALTRLGFPEQGRDPGEVLAVLEAHVDRPGVNPASPRFLGYIPGGGLYQAALGDFLAAATNRYAGLSFVSPGAVRLENALIRWMAGVLGYPPSAGGVLTSGGSIANLTAVVTARDIAGLDPAEASRTAVYLTEHTHHSVDKALHIAGLGRLVRRAVAVDERYRMRPEALEAAVGADLAAGIRPWLVAGAAGTTSTGAVDPLPDLAAVCRRHDLWLHVDGAYGGLFALCPEGRRALAGIEQSDTVVVDPHKTLFLPYGTGAVLARRAAGLYQAFSATADYLQNILAGDGEPSPADASPELTRHFRGLRLWLPLQLAGVAAFRAALSEKIRLARYFHRRLSEVPGFAVGPPPDLSVVTYRYLPQRGDPDAFNAALMHRLQREGQVFVSSTRLDGHLVLRAAILSFRTHRVHVDGALEALGRAVRALEDDAPATP
jgi:glutamate/tyrosine decarboxylase-like PLP-dependent enzyme